ncbi:MAG: HvfA family oxazolone/thioamide-modified RiPP metallophore [bacterium]
MKKDAEGKCGGMKKDNASGKCGTGKCGASK